MAANGVMNAFIFVFYHLAITSFVYNSCYCETVFDSSFHNTIEEINLDVRSLKNELISIKDELTAVRNELYSSRKELTTVRNEIWSTKNEQLAVRNELTATRNEQITVRNELVSNGKKLAEVRTEIVSNRNEQLAMKNELVSTRNEINSTRTDFIILRNDVLATKANILERDSTKEDTQKVHSYTKHSQDEETVSKQTKPSPTTTREVSSISNKSEKMRENLARRFIVLLRTASQEKAFTRRVKMQLTNIINNISEKLSTVANDLETTRKQTELINETVAVNKRLQNDAFGQLRKLNERNKERVDSVTSIMLQYGKDTQKSKEHILELSAQLQEMRADNNNTHSNLQTQLTRHKQEVQKNDSAIDKCQTGDGIGVHSGPIPTYPRNIIVHFDPPFKNKPSVMYGPVLMDNHRYRNLRYDIYLNVVTTEYFKLTIKTWGDTVLYGIKLRWMACP